MRPLLTALTGHLSQSYCPHAGPLSSTHPPASLAKLRGCHPGCLLGGGRSARRDHALMPPAIASARSAATDSAAGTISFMVTGSVSSTGATAVTPVRHGPVFGAMPSVRTAVPRRFARPKCDDFRGAKWGGRIPAIVATAGVGNRDSHCPQCADSRLGISIRSSAPARLGVSRSARLVRGRRGRGE